MNEQRLRSRKKYKRDEMPERNVEIKINETSVSERVYRVKCKSMFASGIFREMIKNIFNHSV